MNVPLELFIALILSDTFLWYFSTHWSQMDSVKFLFNTSPVNNGLDYRSVGPTFNGSFSGTWTKCLSLQRSTWYELLGAGPYWESCIGAFFIHQPTQGLLHFIITIHTHTNQSAGTKRTTAKFCNLFSLWSFHREFWNTSCLWLMWYYLRSFIFLLILGNFQNAAMRKVTSTMAHWLKFKNIQEYPQWQSLDPQSLKCTIFVT